ncbi:MAG: divergent PAP2 family protein [Candidatus Peribacteria bacterium]|nr:MAG: divergent PAP2 family protein [Candidatus Peribacteria bacterium]
MRSAGGFPSVHSGIAASITTLMYLQYGHESAAFVMAFCFSFLFWYDAANVRYEAGQHASYLNQLNKEL